MDIDIIARKIERSNLWESINLKVKKLYEDNDRIPSQEEYQAVRNMIICKVMLEDKSVYEEMKKQTWKELNDK